MIRQRQRDARPFGRLLPRHSLDQRLEEVTAGICRRTINTLTLFEIRGGDGGQHQLQIALELHTHSQYLVHLVGSCQFPEGLDAHPRCDVVDGQHRR
ncbi:Uncharacterised protein [Mycobacteroides abscessus subsp. abscessus]|nr:Uncharacterised protein [Mycobacteroides abscessus subsp. abscessus]